MPKRASRLFCADCFQSTVVHFTENHPACNPSTAHGQTITTVSHCATRLRPHRHAKNKWPATATNAVKQLKTRQHTAQQGKV